jgi:GNAT superfamily N-acetyltransferase
MFVKRISAEETYALRSAVLRPGLPLEANFYPRDAEGWHYGVESAGRIVSVGTIHPENHPQFSPAGQWRIRGMATEPEFRGKGCGSQLLRMMLAETAHLPLIWCNARTPALSFYLRQGFTVESEEFTLPHLGPHRLLKFLPGENAPDLRESGGVR